MRREQLLSLGRKVLIVALLLLAALLFMQTDYFNISWRRLSQVRAPAVTAPGGEARANPGLLSAALIPRAVLVRYPGGGTVATAYQGTETEAAFRRFSAVFGEALGSAGTPGAISEAEFRAGAEAGCVFVDLGVGIPLGLLSEWTGAGGGGAAGKSASIFYLGVSDRGAELCFRELGGGYYRCETAANAETVSLRMLEFQGTEARFAYEDAALRRLDPYAVILSELPVKYGFTAAAGHAETGVLTEAAGMNGYLATSYTDADGTLVLMEEGKALRLRPDGLLTLRGDGSRVAAGGLTAAVDYAAGLALRTMRRAAGDAEIYLSGVTEEGEGTYTVRFDYSLDGVPLYLSSGSAAAVTVAGGTLRSATVLLRTFTRGETAETVLPMTLAASIAAASGGTPTLVYTESGDGIHCAWVTE